MTCAATSVFQARRGFTWMPNATLFLVNLRISLLVRDDGRHLIDPNTFFAEFDRLRSVTPIGNPGV